jgi:rhamnosyl/mannosyltransferase
MLYEARKLNAEKEFDLIHLHFPDPMSHMASISLPSHIPRIISWHSDIVKQRNILRFYRAFQIKEIMRARAIVGATESHFRCSTQIPKSYPKNRQYVIPYGMDFDWLSPKISTKEISNTIKAKAKGRFLLFALGRHVEYKGFSVLLDAMVHTDVYLILAGEGPLTEQLNHQVKRLSISDRVFFVGRQSEAEVAALYHACDAFCLPSITTNEAFGIVQVEAMASRKPVICTQLNNGVNEVNLDGVTGLTVPARDPFKLAAAINRLACDRDLCQFLGANAERHAKDRFSCSRMVDQYHALYTNIKS